MENTKIRGFEVATRYIETEEANGSKKVQMLPWGVPKMPERKTSKSAGYDFVAAETVLVPSIWQAVFKRIFVNHSKDESEHGDSSDKHRVYIKKIPKIPKIDMSEVKKEIQDTFAPTLVHTGIKAYMQDDEVLKLYNRSSNPKKLGLIVANGVGIVDADYYGNKDNDGEIMFAFYNLLPWVVKIKRGDTIGQGVFTKFLQADEDGASGERVGGFGSTDTQERRAESKVTEEKINTEKAEEKD